jgi:hypothetical protein
MRSSDFATLLSALHLLLGVNGSFHFIVEEVG